jgi:hypothetical protein
VFLAASGWEADCANSTRRLAEQVTRALEDFGLSGTREATLTSP